LPKVNARLESFKKTISAPFGVWRCVNKQAMLVTNISAFIAPLVGSGIVSGYFALQQASIFNEVLTGIVITFELAMFFFVVPAIVTTLLVAAIIRRKAMRKRDGK
jgi:ABC-type Mn2+/Zn2+ transport system permease subunit